MEHDEPAIRYTHDLEAGVAKNVRKLRESRGLSQQQLGQDLSSFGVGMHQTTVAKLEAGSKPLRLNEVAAIAAYFEVPIESLWKWSVLEQLEDEGLLTTIALTKADLANAREESARAQAAQDEAAQASKAAGEKEHEAANDRRVAILRQKELAERLADLEQRRDRDARSEKGVE
jgi:transcriptional regulator with XRE-family HTH domain